jgi:TPR repeat protein
MMRSALIAGLGLLTIMGSHAPAHAGAERDAAIAACDAIAGHPDDPGRVGPPAKRENIDLPQAVTLCGAAVAAAPEVARIQYQYGRVLFYAGETDQAMVAVKAAADQGYRQAQFVYGLFVMNGRDGAPTDRCVAEQYWHKSAVAGRQAARMNYVRHTLLGAFDGCPGVATQSELADLLKAGHAEAREYYQRILFEVLEQQLLTKTTSWAVNP